MLAVSLLVVVLLFATCIARQKSKLLVSNVLEVGVDHSHLFVALDDSSLSRALDSLNDADSSYLVGSDAEIVEYLGSPQNSTIQIEIPRVPMFITLTFPDKKTMKIFQVLSVIIICFAGILLICMASVTFFMLQRLKQLKIQEAISIKQEAERKSKIVGASRDMHHALGSIIALIEFCIKKNNPSPELYTNLTKMDGYAYRLQGILKTILGTSKVESRKMHLEEAEFNIADTIEESVDTYNILAECRRLEMIWDPCDFSILKLEKVIGDKQKFKQILGKLLSAALEFTSEGKIVVLARASKQKIELLKFLSDYGCAISHTFSCLSRSVLRYCGGKIKPQDVHYMRKDPYSIELTFEVHYTGGGIPVEKRKSVSPNYIQVKEDSPEGIGLRLGFVQSYVRLMGGEISIQNKEPGERGTCFKFNIFLKSGGVANESKISVPLMLDDSHTRIIHCLLFVQGCETKRILQMWIESLGIKVWTTDRAEHISPILQKIKKNFVLCKTLSWKAESAKNIGFLSNKEKFSECLPIAQLYSELPFRLLIIVDLSNENPVEILSTLIEFYKRNTSLYCKIICIADSTVTEKQLCEFRAVVPCDLTLRKPIHGSRLKELYKLIQELRTSEKLYVGRVAASPSVKLQTGKQPEKLCEIIEQTSSAVKEENFLWGKRVLLVDDGDIMRYLGSSLLSKLGAEVEVAEDGFKALNLVKNALEIGPTRSKCSDYSFAYDAVFMDCQMPEMDGYETAKQIRKEESQYGIHVPIIALSVDKRNKDVKKAMAAGMDHVLEKPLSKFKLADLFKPTGR